MSGQRIIKLSHIVRMCIGPDLNPRDLWTAE